MKRLLFALLASCLINPLFATTGTTKLEWKWSSSCAVQTTQLEFYKNAKSCLMQQRKGTHNTYAEVRDFESASQVITVSLALAAHQTVWSKNDMKSILFGSFHFLEDEDADFTASKERTIPIDLWVKRARSFDLKTRTYGDKGCFAFTSHGGGRSYHSAYLIGVVACNKDGSDMTLDQRVAISQRLWITHQLYKEPRSTF